MLDVNLQVGLEQMRQVIRRANDYRECLEQAIEVETKFSGLSDTALAEVRKHLKLGQHVAIFEAELDGFNKIKSAKVEVLRIGDEIVDAAAHRKALAEAAAAKAAEAIKEDK